MYVVTEIGLSLEDYGLVGATLQEMQELVFYRGLSKCERERWKDNDI